MRTSTIAVLILTLSLLGSSTACAQSISKKAEVESAGTPQFAVRNPENKNPPTITPSSFGFQCGTGRATNCPNATWPTSVAQPGLIRLWDSQVQWHLLNRGPGSYNWGLLDAYLDAIAAHQPRDVMYTFGYTPCWATKGECDRAWGSTFPPTDLSATGSPSFNAFVAALVDHCSPAGHCVRDYIKYWELWNEANAQAYWSGTVPQLYQLMAPAVPIIRKRISDALILTPPVSRGDTGWMRSWLEQENTKGRLSDIFSIHLYLLSDTPEARFQLIREMVELKNNTAGWASTPWLNSETNFDPTRFACAGQYSSDECLGQIVRWHLIHFAFGARHLGWFFFNTTIGRNPEFAGAYKTMMDWLVGGHFDAGCEVNGNVISCPFVQAKGHRALFAWTFNGNASYSPAPEFSDYRTLNGAVANISRGQTIPIGPKPIMLEASN